ncbi:C40 family peptidase [Streptomyces sp. 1331.2]|uniref:C40 family peptidase n=1 Tax=Streptomyces sp. 1331.2 TaxID=1938835 RepID=UPI000BD80FBF|nr:C40 family peptidase [Streptomyces sp. 1331.2]SOB83060.1 Cell wall-associated hydrolase, NlpC family [Streptomyces sp. 1331.2]
MRIATGAYAEPGIGLDEDPGLIGFEERLGSIPAITGCGCPNCAARPRTARGATAAGSSRMHRAVRSTCLATTVLAGAGVVGLTAGAGSAHAAAGKQGWDGSRYWFKNAAGEWRWTSHYDVYTARTGRSGRSGAAGSGSTAVSNGSASSSGLRQGWDGSKYWFKNGSGEWRWTSHYDIYLNRTGQSGGGSAEDPAPAQPAGRPSSDTVPDAGSKEEAVDFALAQLGKPYVWGGDGPSGYDCSGLVQQAYRRAGISLPRVADDQYAATTPISAGQLRRGDLVFWSDSGRASGIHHVGIYLGGNTFVEAPRPGRTVRISTLDSGYYPTHFGRP